MSEGNDDMVQCNIIAHKMAEHGPNTYPSRWPNDPKMAQGSPNEANMGPRWAQEGPASPK